MKSPMRTVFLAGIFLLAAGTVWAHQDPAGSASKARLTLNEVIQIAKKTAQAEKIDLGKYNLTQCHYDLSKGRDKSAWTVSFTQKPPTPPGGHFLVWVDDRTKKATLTRGA